MTGRGASFSALFLSDGQSRPADRDRVQTILAVGILGAISVLVAVASATDRQVQALALIAGAAALVLSIRYPLLPLFAMVALIPIEELVVIDEFGTLSRLSAVLFIVAYGVPRLGRLTIGAMPAAGWIFVGWAAFSVQWAIDGPESFYYLQVLVLWFAVAVLVASTVVERPEIVRPLMWIYSLSAAATAVIGIVGYVTAGGAIGANDRIGGIEGQNPAYYAAILLPAMIFALHELLDGRAVVASAAVAMSCAIAIVVSGTRGAWVAALIAFAIFLLPRVDPVRRVAAIGFVLLLSLTMLQLPGLVDFIEDRTSSAIETGGAGRTDIWTTGLAIFGTSPVTGVGYANFKVAFTPERARENLSSITEPGSQGLAYQDPHNIVVGTLVELGIVGLVILGAFILPLILRRGWGPDAVAIQSALASLAVLALFLDITHRKQVWLLIGIAAGLVYLAHHPVARRRLRSVRRQFGSTHEQEGSSTGWAM